MLLANLRSLLLRHCLNIGDESASSENQGQHADRANLAIQWAIEDFVNAYSWSWRLKTGTCAVATTGIGNLPEDFGTFGAHGSVSINTLRHKLMRIPEAQLFEMRTRDTGTAAKPVYYAEVGTAEPTAGTFLRTLQVHRKPTAPITTDIVYYFRPPLISITDDFTTGDDDDFLLVPAEYHAGVLFDGAAARLLFNIGDPRALEVEQRYEHSKARAWTNDHSYHWPRNRPRYSSRGGVYR